MQHEGAGCVYIVSVCRFESEVQRWSDSGHDIIIIAKEMCSMMVDMSDFTRYPTMPIEPKALHIIHVLHIWQSLSHHLSLLSIIGDWVS